MARRQVTFDLEQGETAQPEPGQQAPPQAATAPPPRNVPSLAPGGLTDRPRRERRKPAWQESGDFDMEASASTVHCAGVDNAEADNSAVGVLGHVKDDDSSMAGSQLPGQYETCPPGVATRTAAMMQSVVRALSKLVDLLANEGTEMDQDAVNLLANESAEVDQAVVKNGGDI